MYDDGGADFAATEAELELLARTGLRADTRIVDLEGFYASRCKGKSMGGYMTWSELQSWMTSLHAAHPSIPSAPTYIASGGRS